VTRFVKETEVEKEQKLEECDPALLTGLAATMLSRVEMVVT
jgi:hypothetical protein